jgi:hypothetical protein
LDVKLDYKPKRIDYTNIKWGNYIELMNVFPIEGAELHLRGLHLTGVDGFQKLVDKMVDVWLPHIKSTQIPGMVSGIAPIKSVVNYGSGVANLVMLPVEQYRKDGRIVKGTLFNMI